VYTSAIPGARYLWDIESFYRYCNCVVLLGFSFLHQVLDEHRLQLKNLALASKCLRAVIIHQDEPMFKGFCIFNSSSLDPLLSCASVHVFNHSITHKTFTACIRAHLQVMHLYQCTHLALWAKPKAYFLPLQCM